MHIGKEQIAERLSMVSNIDAYWEGQFGELASSHQIVPYHRPVFGKHSEFAEKPSWSAAINNIDPYWKGQFGEQPSNCALPSTISTRVWKAF
jgi:hypothetical protein